MPLVKQALGKLGIAGGAYMPPFGMYAIMAARSAVPGGWRMPAAVGHVCDQ